MSIAVRLDELADLLVTYPWGYLVTVREDGRAQSLAIPNRFEDGALVASVGHSTAANATARPNVTMLFPGTSGEEFSLIIDGDASVHGDRVAVTPTWAVLHRPALDRPMSVTPSLEFGDQRHGPSPNVDQALIEELLNPQRLTEAAAVLGRPSAIPSLPGIYAWYFDRVPPRVPTDGCHEVHGSWLLYVGISPKKPSSTGKTSSQDLRKRLTNHYSGNASGSTLRLTMGSLLQDELGIRLQMVGGRLTFGPGEAQLSRWMADHARVAWACDPAPWILEDHLIATLSLPLNLQGNAHHPFQSTLASIRRDARSRTRHDPSAH